MTDSLRPHIVSPYTEEQLELSGLNYEAQEILVAKLRSAFQLSGMTVEELAEDLEIDEVELQGWIDGEADLTFSDLRHYASALDVHVRYKVDFMGTNWPDMFKTLNYTAGWQENDSWITSATPRVLAKP